MRKKFISAFSAVLILTLILTSCGKTNTVRFGTGSQGGTYYKYGEALSTLAQSNGKTSVQVKNTAGSAANIRLVKEGFLDMAIVQSDLLNDAYYGKGAFAESGAYTGYAAVAALYTETCQIVVRADSEIVTVNDLQSKRVSVGEKESGTLQNATQILSVAGMNVSDVEASYLSFADSAKALKSGEIDAFFCTALIMMPVMEELTASVQIRLVGLDDIMIKRLMSNYSGYTQTCVEAGTYNGQSEDIQTVGVKAVLVASNSTSDEKVEEILGIISDNSEELNDTCKLGNEFSMEFAVSDITVPFHKGTKAFYERNGLTVNTDTIDSAGGLNVGQDD